MTTSKAAETANQARDFLQKCLQGRLNPSALVQARLIATKDGFNWKTVQEFAEHERLAPILYTVSRGTDFFPDWYEKELRQTYIQFGFHNARLLQNLQHISRRFAQVSVPLIVLKGAALAETVYENIAIRPMVDVDILVDRENVDHALALLNEFGYVPVDPEVHPGMLAQFENELLLHKSGDFSIALELHWSLLDSPHYQRKIEMDWFWQTAVPATIGETSNLVLGEEALVLHLCSHIMLHHQGTGLLWLHDIAEVLARYRSTIDWETVFDKAQAYDLVISLKQVISQVNDQWNLELPEEILYRLNGLHPSALEQQVFDWLSVRDRPVAQRFWVDLKTSTSWQNRLEYFWRNLFPRPDYMMQRYQIENRYLLPLYYPLRWIKGIASIFDN